MTNEAVDVFCLLTMMAIFSYTDIREFIIPNVLLFPALLMGSTMTGNIVQPIAAFSLIALCAWKKALGWAGGDIKLFAMIAAFVGWLFLPILAMTIFLEKYYRYKTNDRNGLPLAPFSSVATVLILISGVVLRKIVF